MIALLNVQVCYGQKDIEKLSRDKIDSLNHIKVNTILYYRSFCGECEILGHGRFCKADFGYTLISNIIIYRQNGNFYSLDFDCYDQPIKKQIDNCKSIPYSLSIISILNSRDKTLKVFYKKGKFLGPVQVDGTFETVNIYFNKQHQTLSMSNSEKTDLYKIYKKYYWIDSQIKLLNLISADIR